MTSAQEESRATGAPTDPDPMAGDREGGLGDTVAAGMDDAREAAAGLRDQARNRARQEVDRRSSEVGERVKGLAPDIRAAGNGLRERGRGEVADVIDQIADRVAGMGGYLEEADFDTLTRDISRQARERPAALVAAAGALGLAAARFVRSIDLEEVIDAETGDEDAPVAQIPASTETDRAAAGSAPPSGAMFDGPPRGNPQGSGGTA